MFVRAEYDRVLNCLLRIGNLLLFAILFSINFRFDHLFLFFVLYHFNYSLIIGTHYPKFMKPFFLRIFSILPSTGVISLIWISILITYSLTALLLIEILGEFKAIALQLILNNVDEIDELLIKMKPEIVKLLTHRYISVLITLNSNPARNNIPYFHMVLISCIRDMESQLLTLRILLKILTEDNKNLSAEEIEFFLSPLLDTFTTRSTNTQARISFYIYSFFCLSCTPLYLT